MTRKVRLGLGAVALGAILALLLLRAPRDRAPAAVEGDLAPPGTEPIAAAGQPRAASGGQEPPRRPAPRLQGEPSGPGLQTDPTAADYDPSKLLLLGRGSAQEIFASERRDPVWAPRMEAQLDKFAHRILDHLDYATIEETECRAASCALTISYGLAGLDREREIAFLTQRFGLAPGISGHDRREENGVATQVIGLMFPPEYRDPAAAARWSEATLREALEWARANPQAASKLRLPAGS